MSMILVPIERNGHVEVAAPLSAHAKSVIVATLENYGRVGFQPPWIGYLCFVDDRNVGTCAFRGPRSESGAEIAYYTFPESERAGYASQAAMALIELARAVDPAITLTALTLPAESPSSRILAKLGFVNTGPLVHPEDGEVWSWILEAPVAADMEDYAGRALL